MFSRIIEFDISSTYIILIELILCSLFYIIGTFIGKTKNTKHKRSLYAMEPYIILQNVHKN